MINYLEWDSNFFEMKIGQVVLTDDNSDFLLDLSVEDYDLVYLFNKSNLHLDQYISFLPIDIKVNYELNFDEIYIAKQELVELLDQVTESEIQTLLKLTLASGEYSRFNLDSNFKENSFTKLYTQWFYNSLNNENKKNLIVKENNFIVGILILNLKNTKSVIEILAVDKNATRKGYASALVSEAINISLFHQKKTIFVSTQKDNPTANKFYTHFGFKKVEEIEIYHLWK